MQQMRSRIADLERAIEARATPEPLAPYEQRLRAVKAEHRMASEDLRDMDSQSADLYTQQQRLASQMAEARVSYVSSL